MNSSMVCPDPDPVSSSDNARPEPDADPDPTSVSPDAIAVAGDSLRTSPLDLNTTSPTNIGSCGARGSDA
eukprot:scaffold50759_cov27-Phaeocystis_antarctica.AAC.1